VLEEALGLPADQRKGFIDRRCSDDPELHAEVTSLLAHTGAGDAFFSSLSSAIGNQAAASHDPRSRSEIGPFRLGERLGGGVTSVFRATDTRSGEEVALKLAGRAAGNMSASDVDTRMRQEARVLARLKHPAICGLHSTGTTEDGRRYLVLEFIEGEPLHRRVAANPLEALEVAVGAAHIGEALHEAHALRIIHRDLKPANIMVDRTNALRVLDFGAAKTDEADLTATGHTIGTLDYMSPEQLKGEPVGPETDLWSLSLVLWEALFRLHPFRGDTRRDTLWAIANDEPQRPNRHVDGETEAALLDLFRSGLARAPDERPNAFEFSRRAAGIARAAQPSRDRSPPSL